MCEREKLQESSYVQFLRMMRGVDEEREVSLYVKQSRETKKENETGRILNPNQAPETLNK